MRVRAGTRRTRAHAFTVVQFPRRQKFFFFRESHPFPRARMTDPMRAFAGAAVRAAASVARAGPRARPLPSRAVASAVSSASPPSPDDVRTATLRWVDDRVIGYNLCPFAKAPRANDGLKLVVCEHDSTDAFFATFAREVELLCETYTDADEAYDDEDGEEAGPPSAAADADFVNNDENDPDPAPRWRGAGLSEPSTTLIAVPYVQQLADDFVLFLAVAERCEEILEKTGVTDKVQLATLRVQYTFDVVTSHECQPNHEQICNPTTLSRRD